MPDTDIRSLTEDYTPPATIFDSSLTYYADDTPVIMRWIGPDRAGVTVGMRASGLPNTYAFQMVRWDVDGTTDAVAPHVLHRIEDPR